MIDIRCTGSAMMLLSEMVPLQGALKHRTQEDIDELKASLIDKGLIQPIAIWQKNILDGHGRHAALMQMGLANESFPIIEVTASDIDSAKEALLEINTVYGKITPKGLEAFLRDTPKVVVPVALRIKVPTLPGIIAPATQHRTHAVIKLRVEKEKVPAFTEILKDLSYVEIV
jgi:hypothetical protein